jgi:anti-anti-sigma factor
VRLRAPEASLRRVNVEITTTQFKRSDLVKASGRIDSQTAPQLAEAFESIMDAGRYRIVFDMSDVSFVSSAGLRVMIDVQKKCKRWNRGELVLVGVSPEVRGAMDLVGFVPLFQFFDDETTAVGSF